MECVSEKRVEWREGGGGSYWSVRVRGVCEWGESRVVRQWSVSRERLKVSVGREWRVSVGSEWSVRVGREWSGVCEWR